MSAADLLQELRDSLPAGHPEIPGVIRAIEVVQHEKDPVREAAERLYAAAAFALGAIQYPDDRRTLRRAESSLQSAVDRAKNVGISP